eukprot:467796-Amphidinium_carterae.2
MHVDGIHLGRGLPGIVAKLLQWSGRAVDAAQWCVPGTVPHTRQEHASDSNALTDSCHETPDKIRADSQLQQLQDSVSNHSRPSVRRFVHA